MGIISRKAILGMMLLLATLRAEAQPLKPNPLQKLDVLRVQSGPLAGAYRAAPEGGINWYFANVGLYFFVADRPNETREYLERFLAEIDPATSVISDVDSLQTFARIPADSHDAYAATYLRLAARYVFVTGDERWAKDRLDQLKNITYRNILQSLRPFRDGSLTETFQGKTQQRGLATAYLFDNCEVYSGLQAFVDLLTLLKDDERSYFASFLPDLLRGINALFDEGRSSWRYVDRQSEEAYRMYPHGLAQIAALVNSVPVSTTRKRAGFELLRLLSRTELAQPPDPFYWLIRWASVLVEENVPMARSAEIPTAIHELGYYKGVRDHSSTRRKN